MQTFLEWLVEMDTNIGGAQAFWGDSAAKGKEVACGILPMAHDTKRICLNHRSNYINNWIDGKSVDISLGRGREHLQDEKFKEMYMKGCWGTIGGALGGRDSMSAAKEEVAEEIGYNGPWTKLEKSLFWVIPGAGGKGYQNYLGLVPEEKKVQFKPSPGESSGLKHSMESLGITWVTLDEIKGQNSYNGIRFHDGLTDLLRAAGSQIEQMLELNKPGIPKAEELPKPWRGEDVPPDSLASKRLGMFPMGANYK